VSQKNVEALTNRPVSDCFHFSDTSQDSVATHLSCGGIFNGNFITNLLLSLPVNDLKYSNLDRE